MRGKGLLMPGGLLILLMSATACGPAATTGSAASGATSPRQVPSSSSPDGAVTASKAASGSGAVPGGAATNVCSLMSAAQASAINQVTYGATKSQHVMTDYDTCTYANTGQHTDPVDIQPLTVTITSLQNCYAQLQQADGPGTSVQGIGDLAFGYSIGLVVKDGARCIDVSGLTHAELKNDYTRDVAMAKIIITALG
jgi:hypothetical protein